MTRMTLSRLPITAVALAISCVFSLIVILQNPLLNDDAYKYLRAVEVFNESGGVAVLETFGWFNYSSVIALLDRILPGGALAAAHVLNTACYALLTWAFILLVSELRASRRVQLFAALCILGLPLLNEMRYFLIRDIGFCAFALLSVTALVRYMERELARDALWWCSALLLASAFRLEALLLLAFAPCAVLLPDGARAPRERGKRFARLAGTAAFVVAVLLLLGAVCGVNYIGLIGFAYRWYLPLLGDLPAQVAAGTQGFIDTLFGDIGAFLDNVIGALSLPLTLLMLAYVGIHRALPALSMSARGALFSYLVITTITLLTFLAIMHLMTQRYVTLLALLLLTFVPLMLDDLWNAAGQRGWQRHARAILGFYCFYYLVDGLVSFGHSQQHIEDGIAWTRDELPAGAQVLTNSRVIAYHSGRVREYDMDERAASAVVEASVPGDYLVLDIDHDEDTAFIDTSSTLMPVTSFANERGDSVRVYLRQ